MRLASNLSNKSDFELFTCANSNCTPLCHSLEEANKLMRKMIKIRNENSLWENIDVKTGHLRAVDELEKVMGAIFDVYETMSIYVNGKSVRKIWKRGF